MLVDLSASTGTSISSIEDWADDDEGASNEEVVKNVVNDVKASISVDYCELGETRMELMSS